MEKSSANFTTKQATIYYLKMEKAPQFMAIDIPGLELNQLTKPISTTEYLKIYTAVGGGYNWLDRIYADDQQLYNTLNSPRTEIYLLTLAGQMAGFAELVREACYTEILYFGLMPQFVGKRLGKPFLQQVIKLAWSSQPQWVQLNTCSLDHPNALPTYYRAGFTLDYSTTEPRKVLPPGNSRW